METILITGASGYIGSVLLPKLLNRRFNIIAVDNLMYNQRSIAHLAPDNCLTLVKGDIRDKSVMLPLINRADIIIPLGGLVGAPICNLRPKDADEINRKAQLWMLANASEEQLILMPTTNSSYGTTPFGVRATEMSPLSPLSKYATDKVEVEKALMERRNSISFRLATVFGLSPRMRLDLLVNNLTYLAWSQRRLEIFEGHYRRNYVHIQDVVDTMIFAIDNRVNFVGQIFNVGNDSANLTKLELAKLICRIVGDVSFVEITGREDPDKRDYNVSSEKLYSMGVSCSRSVELGIKELINGYSFMNTFSDLANA